MLGRCVLGILSVAIALAALVLLPQLAAADTFTVTKTSDVTGGLRDAVEKSNDSPGPDTIDFAPGLGTQGTSSVSYTHLTLPTILRV